MSDRFISTCHFTIFTWRKVCSSLGASSLSWADTCSCAPPTVPTEVHDLRPTGSLQKHLFFCLQSSLLCSLDLCPEHLLFTCQKLPSSCCYFTFNLKASTLGLINKLPSLTRAIAFLHMMRRWPKQDGPSLSGKDNTVFEERAFCSYF